MFTFKHNFKFFSRIYSNMTQPDHLWTILQTIYNEIHANSTIVSSNLREIITTWTVTNFYSVLNMTLNYENMNMRLSYMLSPYVKYYLNAPIWIHVTLTTESHASSQFDRYMWDYGRMYFTFTENEFVKKELIKEEKSDKQKFDEEVFYEGIIGESKSSDWILSNIQQIGKYY